MSHLFTDALNFQTKGSPVGDEGLGLFRGLQTVAFCIFPSEPLAGDNAQISDGMQATLPGEPEPDRGPDPIELEREFRASWASSGSMRAMSPAQKLAHMVLSSAVMAALAGDGCG